MSKLVLITGGAGYIGSVLVGKLLQQGLSVLVADKMLYGGLGLLPYIHHPKFSYLVGDLRSKAFLEDIFARKIDHIIHLASLVGDPLCAKDPDAAQSTNVLASKKLYQEALKKNVEKFLFISTCSNYGKMAKDKGGGSDYFVDESSELAPVSLYARTKVEVEEFLLESKKKGESDDMAWTILRFATAYGISPRMRFDLTVNEFARSLALGEKLKVYGEQFWRPYCHVQDLSEAMVRVISSPREDIQNEVFNVGDTTENFQKMTLVKKMQDYLPDAQVEYVKKEEDPRDYRVNFSKIEKKLGFKVSLRVDDGIREIINAIREGLFPIDYRLLHSNT